MGVSRSTDGGGNGALERLEQILGKSGGGSIAPAIRGIDVASVREIALMKAYTIGRRALFRDYVDLYFALRSGEVSLAYILANAPRKFTLEGECLFAQRLFLEQLAYTGDTPDREQVLNLIPEGEKISAEEIEDFLRREAGRVARALVRAHQGGPK